MLLQPKSIGIVRTDRIGDVILTIPLIFELSRQYPHASLILFTSAYAAQLFDNSNIPATVVALDETNTLYTVLRSYSLDMIIHVRPRFKELLSSYLHRIQYRIASGYRWYSMLSNHRIYDHRSKVEFHESVYNLRMIASFTKRDYSLLDAIELGSLLQYHNDNKQKYSFSVKPLHEKEYIIIHPGSKGSAKDINPYLLSSIIQESSLPEQYALYITGIAEESALCSILHDQLPDAINVCGTLSLEEMIILIENSSGMIANSTGVLHIAGILQKRVIGFFPNSPVISAKRWSPLSKRQCILSPEIETIDDMSLIDKEKAIECINNLFKQ